MDLTNLPDNLPVPKDNGECDHLTNSLLPNLELPLTSGDTLDLREPGPCVIYIYPMTARPGIPIPDGWDSIPGARGCTPQSCSFRDHHQELQTLGYEVYGLSAQSSDYQQEAKQRLHLPFELISDPGLQLARALKLPTFTVEGKALYCRLTLIIESGAIVKHFWPVFPPDRSADKVISFLKAYRN